MIGSGLKDPCAEGAVRSPLDLHKGIGDPRSASGCDRWPEKMRLLHVPSGALVRGRCRATNLCAYCRTLGVLETVRMWTLDALEYAPTLYVVLTSPRHLTRDECRDHLRQLRKAAKRSWPDAEWCVSVEFQKKGRLHLNLLVKGVPASDASAFRSVVVDGVWCARTDARPVAQFCEVIADGVGVVRYLQKTMAHGLKVEQAPPMGWRGHRTSQTRGYLVRPASVMRAEARRALAIDREVWKGSNLDEAISTVDARLGDEWRLVIEGPELDIDECDDPCDSCGTEHVVRRRAYEVDGHWWYLFLCDDCAPEPAALLETRRARFRPADPWQPVEPHGVVVRKEARWAIHVNEKGRRSIRLYLKARIPKPSETVSRK